MHTKKKMGVLLALAAAMPAFAADSQSDEGVYRTGEILVTGQYGSESEIGSSYVVGRDDFERSGARTLDQALVSIPSINVRNGADGTPRLDIRGLRTRQIKLLVNGIPFNSADDGQFDPTLIPTFAIGRITLQAGASSVLYGDGGMGGALDIQTRGGLQGLQSGAGLELGSNHFWNAHAYIGGGDGSSEFFAAAGVLAKDGFRVADDFDAGIAATRANFEDGGERENSDRRRANVVASFNRQVTDALNVGVFLSHVEGHYGKPPSVFDCRGNSPTCVGASGDPFAATTKYERVDDQRGTSVQAGLDFAPAGNWSGRLWFFANGFEEQTIGYDNSDYDTLVRKNSYRENDDTLMRGVHAQLRGKLEATGAELGIGVDLRRESFDASGISCDNASNSATQTCVVSGGLTAPSAGGTKRFNYSAIDLNKEIDVASYAVQLDQPLPHGFGLVLGAAHHVLDKDGGGEESANSAQIGLVKNLNEASKLYATLARKGDAPTIRQLYDPQKGSNPSGNPDLHFERANHAEIGMKNRWARSSLDIAVYQARVRDFIEKDDTLGYINRQLLVMRGIDVTGELRPADSLTLRAGLGLLEARDESDDAVSETLQYRPRNKFTLDAEYRWASRWALSGSYQHVGAQAYFSKVDPSVHRDLDSYDLVSARLRYRMPCDCGMVYVGADNLLDEEYSTSYGFPQAGRFVYSGLELNW